MRRLVVRRVDEEATAKRALMLAHDIGGPAIITRHGGTVANKYGYPATTEAVTAVAWPDGRVWCSEVVRIPANKATLGGVIARTVGEFARPVRDCRLSDATTAAAREKVIAFAAEQLQG